MFEAEATARRASLPTVPETEARQQVSSSAGDCMLDQPKLTWAVDLGEKVLALSTFDLWYALSAGDIACDVKVWRVGREAWTTALEVPELACALADIDTEAAIPSRQTLDYVSQPPSFGSEAIDPAHELIAGDERISQSSPAPETTLPGADARDEGPEGDVEIAAHDLEEAVETPADELTPSADLPMGQVISLHPVSVSAPIVRRPRARAIAGAFAVAATLAAGFSFLVAFAAPNVNAEAANAALLPAEQPAQPAVAPLFDMEADALAEASARRVSERLASESAAGDPAELVRRVKAWRLGGGADRKTWSPSDAGQTRQRTSNSSKKTSKQPAPKRPNSKQKQR